MSGMVMCYDARLHSAENLLIAYDGWRAWMPITEDEYTQLSEILSVYTSNAPASPSQVITPPATSKESKQVPVSYMEGIKDEWDFIERYYPNYSSSQQIADESDLALLIQAQAIEDEQKQTDFLNEHEAAKKYLDVNYDGDINDACIFNDWAIVMAQIYKEALQSFIATQSEQFTDWAETHYQITQFILYQSDRIEDCTIRRVLHKQGTGGLMELSIDWTNEFEKRYSGEAWGDTKDWTETIEAFCIQKNK